MSILRPDFSSCVGSGSFSVGSLTWVEVFLLIYAAGREGGGRRERARPSRCSGTAGYLKAAG